MTDPSNPDRVYYVAGSNLVAASMSSPVGQQTFFRGHDADVTTIAVSKSGRLVASGQVGPNADVCIWDAGSGALIHRLSEHDHGIAAVAFSPDERLLVSVGYAQDEKVFVWDTRTGNIVASGMAVPKETKGVVFSNHVDGGTHYTFATVGPEAVVVWGVDAQRGLIGGQKCGTGMKRRYFVSVAFSEDSRMIYAGSTSGDVTSFTSNGCVLREVAQVCNGHATVCVPHEGGTFLVGGGDGTVTVFDPARPPTVLNAAEPLCRLAGSVTSVARVHGYDQIVVGTTEGIKYVVPLKRHQGPSELLDESHQGPLSEVVFAPPGCFGVSDDPGDGTKVAVSVSTDGSLRAWSVLPQLRQSLKAVCKNAGGASCVAFTPDALLTGWGDGHVRCHDASTGELLWTLPDANQGGVARIAVAHGLHFFVTGGVRGEVRVWDMRTRSMISNLKEHSARVVTLSVLDDDQHVVSASRDRCVVVWDLIRERRVSSHKQRVGAINAAVVSQAPDMIQVVTAGQDRSLTFWDLREQQPLQVVPEAHKQECTCAALSVDGVLATGSKDQRIKLWDFETGRLLAETHGHCKAVTSLAFSADGKTLISGGEDAVVMAWKVDARH